MEEGGDGDQERLSDFFAERIHDQADEIVEDWIHWIVEVVSLRPARMLPRDAIRDHIPNVVRALANSLRGPTGAVPQSSTGAITSHARMRRDQGYDIEELLKEFRGLADIINNRSLEALESYPGLADARDTAAIFVQLASSMATIRGRTVSVYRETEIHQRRDLHRDLEDYVRTISHELKQPLHAMTAGVEMLSKDGSSSEAVRRQRYLTMIQNGIDRTSNMIENVRRLILTEGAQQNDDWQLLDAAVAAVIEELREPALQRGVTIEVRRPLPRIKIDGTRVQIALGNLISNAVKYSDPDEPNRWIRISAERAGSDETNRWQIEVTDNGLGIPAAVQPHVFERHFRAHPSLEEGTGLGLAISRQVIEQAAGEISFESAEGEGSSFWIAVPGYPDDATSSDRTQPVAEKGSTTAGPTPLPIADGPPGHRA